MQAGRYGIKPSFLCVTFLRPKVIHMETCEPGLSCHLCLAEDVYNILVNLKRPCPRMGNL